MPLLLPDPNLGNVSDWSHSTIFTTTRSTFESTDVPPLTSLWKPPGGCADKWVAGNITFDITYVEPRSKPDGTSYQTPVERDVTSSADPRTGFAPLSTTSEGLRDVFTVSFVAFSTNPGNPPVGRLFDPSYSACQPYGHASKYSPGICPDGQTVAEVTEYQYSRTSGSVETSFEASCCRSSLTFRREWRGECIGNITTPFEIYAPFTTTLADQPETVIVTYEYTARIFMASSYGTDGYSTAAFSHMTTVTAGLIAADPIVVAWQKKDLSVFPTEYVSSLQQKFSVTWVPSPTPASTSALPQQTNPPSNDLGTGAKAGISIGAVLGVAGLVTAIILLLIRGRRKGRVTAPNDESGGFPEMED